MQIENVAHVGRVADVDEHVAHVGRMRSMNTSSYLMVSPDVLSFADKISKPSFESALCVLALHHDEAHRDLVDVDGLGTVPPSCCSCSSACGSGLALRVGNGWLRAHRAAKRRQHACPVDLERHQQKDGSVVAVIVRLSP